MSEALRWKKMKKWDSAGSEALLRDWESWCVAACGRFLKRNNSKDQVWTLRDRRGGTSALIVQSKRTLLPVLCGRKDIPLPHFLYSLFNSVQIRSLQGLKDEAFVLEQALADLGLQAVETIDYELMFMDTFPNSDCFKTGLSNLIIRRPRFVDMNALAVLHAGYEREEVLPKDAEFSPAASRMNIEHIVKDEKILVAELDGRLVGKINTNAVSFTRFQIGGVYVHPDFRGLGIGRRMTAEFVRSLIALGKGVSLFVKKSNPAACRIYNLLGFRTLGDYRISYF